MKIQHNMVVTFSYVFESSEEGEDVVPTGRYRMTVLMGREMMPREMEEAFYGREEGDQFRVAVPMGEHEEGSGDACFFSFDRLPEGIEVRRGGRFCFMGDRGKTEMMVIEDVLPDGVLAGYLQREQTAPRERWINVCIESVRWASLREYQEGRVMGGAHGV